MDQSATYGHFLQMAPGPGHRASTGLGARSNQGRRIISTILICSLILSAVAWRICDNQMLAVVAGSLILDLLLLWVMIGLHQSQQRAVGAASHMASVLEEFKQVMEHVEGISQVDAQGANIGVNGAYARMCGYAPGELLGQNRIATVHPNDRQKLDAAYQRMLKYGDAECEARGLRKDGSTFYKLVTMIARRDQNRRFIGHYCFIKDITHRKRAEQQLAQLNSELRQKNQKLEAMTEQAHRFVDDVSHEFRTPLTVIKEFASIIADGLAGPVSEEQTEYLRILDASVIDLSQMVDDFLDSSKLRAGRLRVDRRRHDISELFDAVRPTIERKAASRRITILERIDAKLWPVFCDQEKARRVIMNLATNAIKFSPEDSAVTLRAKPDGHGGVYIGVSDQGPGMSPKDTQMIFDRFKQLDSARNPSVKGFGLGLNIAQELVWLNLGRIGVNSAKGEGTTFWFTLPPDDPAQIAALFFDRLEESNAAATQIAILAVWSVNPGEDLAHIRDFLASTIYARDVILPHARNRGLILLGETGDAQAWVNRIRQAAQRAALEAQGQRLDGLAVKKLGGWSYPQGREAARTHAIELVQGVHAVV